MLRRAKTDPFDKGINNYSTDQMQGIRRTCFDTSLITFIASDERAYH